MVDRWLWWPFIIQTKSLKTKNFNVLCFVCAKTASKAVLDMNSQVLEPVKVLSAGTRNQKT